MLARDALFLAGTVVGGVAVGAVFLGSLATANRLAPPGRRGQVVSAYFVLCYCGLIIPVVGVGVASEFIGDFRAVLALSILLAALCLFSLVGIWRSLLPAGRPQAPGADDASRHSIQDSSHSEGGEAACPPGLKTRVSTPRS
jgi:MFS family permease